jgi:hypothetical protein
MKTRTSFPDFLSARFKIFLDPPRIRCCIRVSIFIDIIPRTLQLDRKHRKTTISVLSLFVQEELLKGGIQEFDRLEIHILDLRNYLKNVGIKKKKGLVLWVVYSALAFVVVDPVCFTCRSETFDY